MTRYSKAESSSTRFTLVYLCDKLRALINISLTMYSLYFTSHSVPGFSHLQRVLPRYGRRVQHLSRTKRLCRSRVVLANYLPQVSNSYTDNSTNCILSRHSRLFTTGTDDVNGDNGQANEEWEVIYEGLMAGPLKRIKMVSITTCSLSLITMPLLVAYGNQDVALSGRLAVAFTAGIFGVGTTTVVHFIGKTYVGKLWKKIRISASEEEDDEDDEDEDPQLMVETYNLFGRKKQTEFLLSEVEEGDPRPFCSFKAHGLNFFLHHEADAWYDGEDGRIDELFTRPIESAEDQHEE